MDDYISRQAAIQVVHGELDECLVWDESGKQTANEVEDILYRVPTADAVEVVRCKDCYHYDEENEYCIFNDREMKLLDFCSYGSI